MCTAAWLRPIPRERTLDLSFSGNAALLSSRLHVNKVQIGPLFITHCHYAISKHYWLLFNIIIMP